VDWLYDKNGRALLFTYNDRFISKKGKNLGWIFNNNVYGLRSGKHLGWFENGVLYDGMNRVIAFSWNSSGYLPSRPGIGGTPGTPGIPGRPGTPALSGTPGRLGYGGWSKLSIGDFFGITV